jgi:D-alanine-D-alanine ligase
MNDENSAKTNATNATNATTGSAGRRPRVAVIFGGRSSEHAISCVTAGSVLSVLDQARYEVLPIGVTTEGRWVLSEATPEELAIEGDVLPSVNDESSALVTLGGDSGVRELTMHEPGAVPKALGEVDVVFPLLHGPFGEDGTLQGLLELAGVPYVGSGVLSSAACMDKEFMKRLFVSAGLPTVDYAVIRERDWRRDPAPARAAADAFGYPVFVKPARAGSSMGVTKVHSPAEFDAAVAEAHRHDPKALVEPTVRGREIECGVLVGADGEPEASVPGEILVGGEHDYYDFAAKYLPEQGTTVRVPAELTAAQTARVRELAVAVFTAMDCEGLARIDFFLTDDGEFLVNEANTLPGFTPTSVYPRLWEATGVSYAQLVERLLQAALHRPVGLR